MSEAITVTFGGRDVVLKTVQKSYPVWEYRGDYYLRVSRVSFHYDAIVANGAMREEVEYDYDSPQAAVTSLESKLRALRDQLSEVLGQ